MLPAEMNNVSIQLRVFLVFLVKMRPLYPADFGE
jgi:hypothetical protein